MHDLKEYINKNKWIRLISYLIDVAFVLLIGYLIFPLFSSITVQSVLAQIADVHTELDPVLLQEKTLTLMKSIEKIMIAIATTGCIYDAVCMSTFASTIGKAIMGLKVQFEEDTLACRIKSSCIRGIVKALITAFLGSILLVFSGFAVISSKEQISMQDRIAKTKIVSRKG